MTIRLAPDSAGVPQIEIVPRSLIAWLWLEKARELTGENHWARCAFPLCGKLFLVGKGHTTMRRRYCCDSHRTLDNRRKRKEAST
jgi:hypothetical protein